MKNCSPEAIDDASPGDMREHVRNRQLRRVDWRFLLPNPAPEVSVCVADGPLWEAVARISRTMVLPERLQPDSCDLAVAVDPEANTLRDLFVCLRPGGSCYVEYTGRGTNAAGTHRHLAAAGFEQVRAYTPWPSVERCRVWLPLDAPAAASAYLYQQLTGRRSLRGVLQGRVRTALMQHRLALPSRVCAIGSKPAAQRAACEPSPVRGVIDYVAAHWDAFGTTGPRPVRLSPVLQAAGPRSISKVVALFFDDRGGPPAVAVKIARVPEAVSSLGTEAAMLDAVHAMPDAPAGIPRVLFRMREPGMAAVGETTVSGWPVSITVSRRTYPGLASAATGWLIQLARASSATPGVWDAMTASASDEFEATYGGAIAPHLPDAIRRRLADAQVLSAAVCEHRDFSPWNVWADRDGSLAVLDWESSTLRGVPGLDLIYFLTYLAWYRDGVAGIPSKLHAYRAAWDPATGTGRVNQKCVAGYAHAIGVSPSAWPALRLLTWLIHARSEYRRFVEDHGAAPSPDVLRRGLFLGLIETETGLRNLGPIF